jgi:hypothetical protein
MNGTPFKLATLTKPNAKAFVAIVLGDCHRRTPPTGRRRAKAL